MADETRQIPIVCDMTDATDTAAERLAEYRALFASALVGRERTQDGVRFRLAAGPGVEDQVRELADRETRCCAFFSFVIERHGDEIWWDAGVVDDDVARRVLDEFHRLPDTLAAPPEDVRDRFSRSGLDVVVREGGGIRPATPGELGIDG